MSGLDTNGDGLVDMRIGPVKQDMGVLRGRVDALAGAVRATFDDIEAATSLLGKGGKMSDQFIADYRMWRAGGDGNVGLDQSINDVPVNHRLIVDAGDVSVAKYEEAEQQVVNQFPR